MKIQRIPILGTSFETVTELKHWVLIENEQFMSFLKQLEGIRFFIGWQNRFREKFTKYRLFFFSERERERKRDKPLIIVDNCTVISKWKSIYFVQVLTTSL